MNDPLRLVAMQKLHDLVLALLEFFKKAFPLGKPQELAAYLES